MPSELPSATPANRAMHRSSLITTSSLLLVLVVIMQNEHGSGHTAPRSALLHLAMFFAVASFVMQAIAARRMGLRWPARIAPASLAAGVAAMDLGSLSALSRGTAAALTDVGFTLLLAGVIAFGIDIVSIFRSPSVKA